MSAAEPYRLTGVVGRLGNALVTRVSPCPRVRKAGLPKEP